MSWVVRPGVHKLVDHIPGSHVRYLQQLGSGAQVELGEGIDGVVVDRHERIVWSCEPPAVPEAVERRSGEDAGTHGRVPDDLLQVGH
jgi:hypothetical protein